MVNSGYNKELAVNSGSMYSVKSPVADPAHVHRAGLSVGSCKYSHGAGGVVSISSFHILHLVSIHMLDWHLLELLLYLQRTYTKTQIKKANLTQSQFCNKRNSAIKTCLLVQCFQPFSLMYTPKKNNLSSKVQVLILNSNPRNMFIKLILHWMAFFIIINIMETTKNSLFN